MPEANPFRPAKLTAAADPATMDDLRRQLERASLEAQLAQLELEIAQIKQLMPPEVRAQFEREAAARAAAIAAQPGLEAQRAEFHAYVARHWRDRAEQVAKLAAGKPTANTALFTHTPQ